MIFSINSGKAFDKIQQRRERPETDDEGHL